MPHTIVRHWNRHAAAISTRHPVHGRMDRGTVRLLRNPRDPEGRCMWLAYDQDGAEVIRHVGDYRDAEQALLDATTWAEQISEEG